MELIRERALRIGKPNPLVSIVSEPKNFDAEKPAVIILNSGVMHHIGTCRLSVKIARSLADNGILALRFDFSGIGDSESRRGAKSFEESAPVEVAEVMDYLEKKKGIKKFILYGLCSGADASYETAKLDERVIGIIQIDAYCYRTLRWYINHYGPRMIKAGVWRHFFARLWQRLMGQKENVIDEYDEEFVELPSYIRVFPEKAEVAKGLSQLVQRKVHMYAIFTGGQSEILNYQSQYEESFGIDFCGLLRTDYFPKAEHIIPEPEYQRLIPERINEWVLALSQGIVSEHCS